VRRRLAQWCARGHDDVQAWMMLARDEGEFDAIHSASQVDVGDQQGELGTELPQDELRGLSALTFRDDVLSLFSRTAIACGCDASVSRMSDIGRIGFDCPSGCPQELMVPSSKTVHTADKFLREKTGTCANCGQRGLRAHPQILGLADG